MRFAKDAEAVSLTSASLSGGSDCQNLDGACVQNFSREHQQDCFIFN